MLKFRKEFEEWEKEWIKSTPVNYRQNLKIFDALIKEARLLGVWPPQDPMEGIENCIRTARILNGLKADPEPCPQNPRKRNKRKSNKPRHPS